MVVFRRGVEMSHFTDFHADDYGLFRKESERILECCEQGALTGVSVMTTSPVVSECMEMLMERCPHLLLQVHLNFYDGKALAAPEVPLLTDENGVFHISFSRLVLASYIPFMRKKLLPQLEKELWAQMLAMKPWVKEFTCADRDASVKSASGKTEQNGRPDPALTGEGGLRLDGHGHYHMIPIVFDALMNVIRRENLNVTFIRQPYEELSMYRPIFKKMVGFKPVNLLKVIIINHFVRRNRRKYPFLCSLPQQVFSGILFSTNLRIENAGAILPELEKLEKERGCMGELLFHPGGVYEKEDLDQITIGKDRSFFCHENRRLEYEALHQITKGDS